MARDMHDTLAQGFTGVIIQLEAAEDATSCGQQTEADKHLHRAAALARQSLSEARRSVHALRPDALERDNFGTRSKESSRTQPREPRCTPPSNCTANCQSSRGFGRKTFYTLGRKL